MECPPKPSNESERLDALDKHQVLDTPPDASFDRITRLARRMLKTPIALVSLVDKKRQWVKSRQGLDAEEVPRSVAFCAHTICEDDVMVVPDASRDQRFADNPLVAEDPKVRFYAGAPIQDSDGHTLGTLCVLDTTPRELDAEQEAMLESLASIVMDEMHLRRLASFDPLTGLPNRRYFMDLCEVEHRRAGRYGHAVSIALFDVDHFKRINDEHGHDAGDAVLEALSKLCGETIRSHDIVCRYGGEEFAILMPHTGLHQAMCIADRLRALVSDHRVIIEDMEISFTISVGVTPLRIGAETPGDALSRADKALYDAKARGRNRVISAAAPPNDDSPTYRETDRFPRASDRE